jgi:pyruvate formate lyase activating enzyme
MVNATSVKLPITSITPFTFQDYPEHTACILWFSGCNMACGYCHNPELVKGALKKLPWEQVTSFLESRAGLLDGVVLTGGECTLCPALPDFARYLKSLGYKVKVDTNGTNSELLARLLDEGLVDYIALDFKAPKAKFAAVTGYDGYERFNHSLMMLCKTSIPVEIRTTVHTALLNEEDINEMASELEGYGFSGIYYLQKFRQGQTLGNLPDPVTQFNPDKLVSRTFHTQLRNF